MRDENIEALTLAAVWARNHFDADTDTDVAELMEAKLIHNRLEHALRMKDYWERQTLACEKALDKIEKNRSAIRTLLSHTEKD